LVCGVGLAGSSAARALLAARAQVQLTARTRGDSLDGLLDAGATWAGPLDSVPADVELIIASPGIHPDDTLLLDAATRAVPVWGEAELAWQLRGHRAAPWLAVTGTNGKTTTVHMLEAMLVAAGLRAVAVGNVGVSMIEAVLADPPYDVLAVELSSQQLHFAPSLAPAAGAILNLAPDHLDWHGTFERYVEAKARMFSGAAVAIGNADDPAVARLLATCSAATRVSFTLAAPGPDQLGVCVAQLVSRAFGDDGLVLIGTDAVRPPGQLNVANALAAAALARAQGVPAAAIADGLRRFVADPHRNQYLVTIDGVAYVDDSKATNAHAARGSLLAYQRIVWVAGGQLKGASVDELVAEVSSRLAAVVLLGADRAVIADAVRRHAPEIPLIEVANTDDRAMLEVVRAAAGLARPGDTVLLAPAGASYDMYANYSARGRAFEAAARELGEG